MLGTIRDIPVRVSIELGRTSMPLARAVGLAPGAVVELDRGADDQVDLWRGRQVEIRLRQVDNYQLDGDVSGAGRMLTAEVRPGALQVRVAADHDESAADATAAAGSAR